MWASIFGVIGTLLGVLLGFLLNELKSIGRLNIFTSEINIYYLYRGQMGEVNKHKEYSNDVQGLRVYLEFDFYNSSGKNKVIRKLQLEISKNTNTLRGDLSDTDTQRVSNLMKMEDTVRSFVVPPRTVVSKRLNFLTNENIFDLEGSNFTLTYYNNKNKIKTEKIILPTKLQE